MKTSVIHLSLIIALMAMIRPGPVIGQSVGSSAPDFTLSTDIGTEFTLSSQRGRVVFIFFFGYACPHCLENGNNTVTGIFDFYKENSDFVAIGVDTWDGTEDGVASFKSSTGLTYPVCYDGSALESLYSTTYDRVVVVDRMGIIQYKSSANTTTSVVQEASNVISSLLNATSAENIQQGDDAFLTVYPNPAADQIYIRSSSMVEEAGTIFIRNTSGQVLAEKQIRQISGEKSIGISVSSLPPGIYLVQYQSGKKSVSVKLVVESN
ncbi:MAG: T9SS type A sorting domain-containing protein [Bacteroidales bacterium]